MYSKKAYLRSGKDESARRYHPWIYFRGHCSFGGIRKEGDLVRCMIAKKNYLGAVITRLEYRFRVFYRRGS